MQLRRSPLAVFALAMSVGCGSTASATSDAVDATATDGSMAGGGDAGIGCLTSAPTAGAACTPGQTVCTGGDVCCTGTWTCNTPTSTWMHETLGCACAIDAGTGADGGATLTWFQTCGDPVCRAPVDGGDDTSDAAACPALGSPCTTKDETCGDRNQNCGVIEECEATDPRKPRMRVRSELSPRLRGPLQSRSGRRSPQSRARTADALA